MGDKAGRRAGGEGPHAVSIALRRVVDAKRDELWGKTEELGRFGYADKNGQFPDDSDEKALFAEVAALEKVVECLSLEADEQFARELAELEE